MTADYKDGCEAPDEEFDLARTLIEARTAAGLSQSQLARRMKTSQSYIARIEGGKVRSTDRLERFPQATHTRLRIVFEPQTARQVLDHRRRRCWVRFQSAIATETDGKLLMLLNRLVVSQIFVSWNPLTSWLRKIEALRSAA
jgi:transcriptional regulator with XRE-family HTH domain